MFNNLWKQILCVLVTIAVVNLAGICGVKADTMPGGYMAQPEFDISSEIQNVDSTDVEVKKYSSQKYNHDWDAYSSNYIYNLLSLDEREVWDCLEVECNNILNSSAYYEQTNYVYSSVLSKDEMKNVAYLFQASNPQYFFLYGIYFGSSSQGTRNVIGFRLYKEFYNGSTRVAARDAISNQIKLWKGEISSCSGNYEKVKKIHDLICTKVVYDYDFASNMNDQDEQIHFSQSIYSVFCMDKTVCAGYAKAFTVLCNMANIDSFCVTSQVHEWNKVKLKDSWYNMDCTWDDSASGIEYTYFCKNDKNINDSAHTPENRYKKYLPPCTLDSGATETSYGKLPAITNTVATPTISTQETNGQYLVSMSTSTSGATIYYTLNGISPSSASTKSYCYTQPFYLSDISNLKAMAVLDGYYDSDTSTPNSLNGLAKGSDGQWYYYVNGYVDTTCNDIINNSNGWWYVQNGKVRFNFTGIAKNSKGEWYVRDGKVDFGKNEVVKVKSSTSYYADETNVYDGWYNIVGGRLVRSSTVASNPYGWWYIGHDGKVDFDINTVAKNNNGWWVIQNGKVNFGFNGIADNNNGSWYCNGGKVQFGANGVLKTPTGWYYIKNGAVQKGTETIEKNPNGWWYIGNDGKVDFTFNGIAQNSNGYWYIKNGKVDFSYNGIYEEYNMGMTYYIENGKVVR